jgi:D-serine deaminase-like pyridoxal phosphate-dependent protein
VRNNPLFGVLVEFDVGLGRCGLDSGTACVALATKIQQMPGLKFRGLMLYSGNIWGSEAERQSIAAQVSERVRRVLQAFVDMPVEIVPGGSTPGAFLSQQIR